MIDDKLVIHQRIKVKLNYVFIRGSYCMKNFKSLHYKNLEGDSYKDVVYSFGKQLMEMTSWRKNGDVVAECSSHIYFSLRVHDHLSEGLDIPVEEVSEEDRRIVKKMVHTMES